MHGRMAAHPPAAGITTAPQSEGWPPSHGRGAQRRVKRPAHQRGDRRPRKRLNRAAWPTGHCRARMGLHPTPNAQEPAACLSCCPARSARSLLVTSPTSSSKLWTWEPPSLVASSGLATEATALAMPPTASRQPGTQPPPACPSAKQRVEGLDCATIDMADCKQPHPRWLGTKTGGIRRTLQLPVQRQHTTHPGLPRRAVAGQRQNLCSESSGSAPQRGHACAGSRSLPSKHLEAALPARTADPSNSTTAWHDRRTETRSGKSSPRKSRRMDVRAANWPSARQRSWKERRAYPPTLRGSRRTLTPGPTSPSSRDATPHRSDATVSA